MSGSSVECHYHCMQEHGESQVQKPVSSQSE